MARDLTCITCRSGSFPFVFNVLRAVLCLLINFDLCMFFVGVLCSQQTFLSMFGILATYLLFMVRIRVFFGLCILE